MVLSSDPERRLGWKGLAKQDFETFRCKWDNPAGAGLAREHIEIFVGDDTPISVDAIKGAQRRHTATRSQLHHCWRSAGWLKAELLPESYAPPSSSVSIFEASNDSLVADYVQRARDANTHLLPWSSPLACYSSPDKNQPNKPLLLVILSDSLGLHWIKMKEVWIQCYDHSV